MSSRFSAVTVMGSASSQNNPNPLPELMISVGNERSRFDLREQIGACSLNSIGRCASRQIGIDVQKANGRDFGLFRLRMSLAERLHFVGVEINAVSLAVGFDQPSQCGGLVRLLFSGSSGQLPDDCRRDE